VCGCAWQCVVAGTNSPVPGIKVWEGWGMVVGKCVEEMGKGVAEGMGQGVKDGRQQGSPGTSGMSVHGEQCIVQAW